MKNSTYGGRTGSTKKKTGGSATKVKRSARELWIDAVKTGDGTLGGGKKPKPGKPGKRNASEYWMDALRKTGEGHSTESTGMNTFTGIKRPGDDLAYLSTSHYLRQMTGVEKTPRNSTINGKVSSSNRKPAYKSQEEYYDEILDLKKHVVAINNENTTMKSKMRRLEEDNSKKEKEIEQLLDPGKSEEMRRTLGDRKPDAGAVIHSLKQKILRLEQNLKEKEAAHVKLQSDMKGTKIEEMKIQMEAYFAEIQRLHSSAGFHATQASSKQMITNKDSNAKLKAMNETIIRLNDHNNKLQTENKELKADLEKSLENAASTKEKIKKEYEDMNRKELITAISRLEKRMDKTDADTISLVSEVESRRGATQGKIILQGTLAAKLDQLDRRETELLEDIEKQRASVVRLKNDRQHYRKCCDDKDQEIGAFKKEVDFLQKELDSFYEKDKSRHSDKASPHKPPSSVRSVGSLDSTPRRKPPREKEDERERREQKLREEREEEQRQRKLDSLAQQRAARTIQKNWKNKKHNDEEMKENESLAQQRAARTIQKNWKNKKHNDTEVKKNLEKSEHSQKAQEYSEYDELRRGRRNVHFRRDSAARVIQGQWRGYRRRSSGSIESTTVLQSTIRGHQNRKNQITRLGNSKDDDPSDDNDDDILTIQSAMRGHSRRKEILRKSKLSSESDTESTHEAVSLIQATLQGHVACKKMLTNQQQHRLSSESDTESTHEAVSLIQATLQGHVARKKMLTNQQQHSSPTLSRKYTNGNVDYSDDDDDIEDGEVKSVSNRSSFRPSPRVASSSAASHSGSTKRGNRSPPPRRQTPVEDDDDDDDIVF